MIVLAIDPGPTNSAWVLYDVAQATPLAASIVPNAEMELDLWSNRRVIDGNWTKPPTHLVIEKVEAMGMSVGVDVFETVYHTGRFANAWDRNNAKAAERIGRKTVKMHLCQSMRAKDANIRQAIIDRFGGVGGKETAIGKKATPGPLFGMKSHLWAALAVALTYADTHTKDEE
jgi:hypothetical protein